MVKKKLKFEDSGLTKKEWRTLEKLSSPKKIQDFLNKLSFNHEYAGRSIKSPHKTLSSKSAHCLEGALLAAAALWAQGEKPLLMDLMAKGKDDDHVIALYKRNRKWGAISKTNHAVLRYREPIYRDLRELALSYFHEYFLKNGKKTLRKYSKPFDLSRLGIGWLSSEKDLTQIAELLDASPHSNILTSTEENNLRLADKIEREVMETTEYP